MDEQVVFRAGEGPYHQIRPDLEGVLIGGEKVTLVRWEFPVGRPATPVHSHRDHEQFCIMLSGTVRTVLGDETVTLSAGDVMRIQRNVPHGATVVVGNEPAVMLDVYSPPREEYVAAAAKPAKR
ncbi:MAG TPA: cupin domain-containing protein [Bauldia sp.]|nr:cupin domain-containing protein [Bauldia sp.]